MKNILFLTLLSGAALVNSCSNDFEVSAPWKDIPVVYGLLNIQDTAHYIRVEKAFLDPDANALDIARNPDSLYYDNILVQLEKVNTGEVFTLEKVDGNLEGYPRESGVFADAPNWLYKIDSLTLDLHEGDSIRLRIDRGDGLPAVTAGTSIIEKGSQRKPAGTPNPKFAFNYNLPTTVAWRTSQNARIFDVKLVINYSEYPIDDPSAFEKKSIEWKWGQGIRFDMVKVQYDLEKQGIEFFQVMQNNIPVNPDMKRIFEGIDIIVINGGFALEKYINVALANTGITGSQEIPTYTNLSEGKGVFSTINYIVKKHGILVPETRDSLKNGMFTKDLNF